MERPAYETAIGASSSAQPTRLVETMKEHGSTVLMEPADMFWGERFGRVRDPFGHEWGIATQLREMSPEEIQSAAIQMFADMSE